MDLHDVSDRLDRIPRRAGGGVLSRGHADWSRNAARRARPAESSIRAGVQDILDAEGTSGDESLFSPVLNRGAGKSMVNPTRRSAGESSFSEQAEEARAGVFDELVAFLRDNKRWWLTPIIVVLFLVGALLVLGGTAAAPFIYTLF